MKLFYSCINVSLEVRQHYLHYLNVEIISCAISKMKAGKNDGYDGLTSDYLKN